MTAELVPDKELTGWIRNIRRELHRHPELSYQEFQTARYICYKLQELDIPFQSNIAETGIVASLGPDTPGAPCVALRADMDALPITEQTGLEFASQNPGVMHACGHDGHVAMLLGAAALLKKHPVPGRVVFIFQPAEEGDGGARRMIAEGALQGVDAIFAGHIDRHFDVNQISVDPGLICAYTDEFVIEIKGRGGHAAKPHETIDSIVVASLLVMAIQTLVSREVNPAYPSVVTVGKIHGGSAANVIAEKATLEGTLRTTHPQIRDQIIKGLTRMVKSMEDLYNAQTSMALTEGYPPVINDETAAAIAKEVATKIVGATNVIPQSAPSMGGEDFSFFLAKVPGCFVRFGARKEGLDSVPAHSPRFDFDEGVLPVGAAFFAQTALEALQRMDELRGK